MAEIRGFHGLLYNSSKLDMSAVLAPPYDVIDEAGRAQLAEQDAHNCVRLIMPEANQGEGKNKYEVAAGLIEAWQEEGTLQRDEAPTLYRYHQVFRHQQLGDALVVRRGFIAAVRLHNFEERVILRHERTLSGPKADRLKLWEATHCHLSQIFTLYSDPNAEIDALFVPSEEAEPAVDATSADGTRHLLWRESNAEVVAKVRGIMDSKSLYIADGHHRYETMLALRDKLLGAAADEVSPMSSVRFGMMFLANIDDPGLVVLPTHRMIRDLPHFDAAQLRTQLSEFFLLDDFELPEGGIQGAMAVGEGLARGAGQGTCFALVIPGEKRATLLTLRTNVDLHALGLQANEQTLALDVTLLHGLVLETILGIDRAAQESQAHIDYLKDTRKAIDACAAGHGQACFFMNATPVEQVVAVSDAGEVMPQKSTFFYPKIASGLVLNPIAVDEELG